MGATHRKCRTRRATPEKETHGTHVFDGASARTDFDHHLPAGPKTPKNANSKAPPPRLRVLFLGDRGHHRPADRAAQIKPVLAGRGIDLTYTENVKDLNRETLSKYDALLIYANTESIAPDQEKALLDYVEEGGGFVPLHCASYCFLNSPKYIALVGAQFQRHGTGMFDTKIVDDKHPIMKGFEPFRTWDETYVHRKHNEKDRHGAAGAGRRRQLKSRGPGCAPRARAVSSTPRTATTPAPGKTPAFTIWSSAAFAGRRPRARSFDSRPRVASGLPPFTFTESAAEIPNYLPGRQWGTQGEPIRKMQNPLPPQESQRHLVVPAGFEARLFAAEPEIYKPLCMTWDERGRLWIAESTDYPNTKRRDGQGRDRITICEDTNGDGRADSFKVFAEGLNIPTSLLAYDGGVIVLQAPDTLFLKDTNGDGRADVKKVLFTGWGIADTHAGPSNLRWGLDNWIYGIVGYSAFRGTVGGETVRFGQGLYRFKPDGSKLEFLRSTGNNSWGVGFSEEGLVFGSTANGCPSVYLPIPNRYYEAVRGWSAVKLESIAASNQFYPVTEQVRQVDYHGGFTAAAGHALYTARTYPPRVLELDRVRHGADRALGRHVHARQEGQRRGRLLWLEHARQRRRVDRSDRRGSGARRARLGHRLVQLHRSAQSDAARLPHRPRQRIRDADSRPDSRADLPRGLQGCPGLALPGARQEQCGRAGCGPAERQPALAAARPAAAGRAEANWTSCPH